MKHLARFIALATLGALAALPAAAQGRKSLRINEVMVKNDSSIVDDYGRHSAWIELHNPTHAPVNISSIYLTDDINNPTKYYVPGGDASTKIGKGQQALFWADGHDTDGTFHLNFTLTPGRDNFIAVFDADGINLIDSVTVPASLAADCSYARTPDGADSWAVRSNSSEADAVTPGGLNVIKGPNSKIKMFEQMDSHGFAMAAMAMGIVFGALLVLCICFMLIRNLSARSAKAANTPYPTTHSATEPLSTEGEVAAAIALALHQQLNAGVGNSRLTIQHNPASGWSQKIMRQYPQR
ncbi:MAG: lamin tail domain-containing protein [Bacteroides sp.]|nr:lamin tail domain-containing protein [Bacteroides sp.]MCM1378853.1 lamin tail domain-containing protein [Bacteroides sp.]MCM1445470.1 lamin tail domain-containing protein [Prevotella sp.]